jgi:hypothetical protein
VNICSRRSYAFTGHRHRFPCPSPPPPPVPHFRPQNTFRHSRAKVSRRREGLDGRWHDTHGRTNLSNEGERLACLLVMSEETMDWEKATLSQTSEPLNEAYYT